MSAKMRNLAVPFTEEVKIGAWQAAAGLIDHLSDIGFKQLHFMIDVETTGKKENAGLISIGIVPFTEAKVLNPFKLHIKIDPTSIPANCEVDLDTIMWWMKQSEQAKKEWEGFIPFKEAIEAVSIYFNAIKEHGSKKIQVWAKSPKFDCNKLEFWMSYYGLPYGYDFWETRDVRTILELAKMHNIELPQFKTEDIPHNAAHDAFMQAMQVLEVLQVIADKFK